MIHTESPSQNRLIIMKVIRTDAATIDSHIDSDYVYVTHYAP